MKTSVLTKNPYFFYFKPGNAVSTFCLKQRQYFPNFTDKVVFKANYLAAFFLLSSDFIVLRHMPFIYLEFPRPSSHFHSRRVTGWVNFIIFYLLIDFFRSFCEHLYYNKSLSMLTSMRIDTSSTFLAVLADVSMNKTLCALAKDSPSSVLTCLLLLYFL